MNEVLLIGFALMLALGLGIALGWLLAGARVRSDYEGKLLEAEKRAATSETALQAEREKLAEEKKRFEELGEKLKDTFKALASDVLSGQSQSFLTLARQAFEKLRADAEGDLGKRQEAIQGLVQPLQVTIGKLEAEMRAMEDKRQKAYGGLEEQLKSLATSSQELQRQAGNLTTALKGMPQMRGKWGELALRRVVELAGMTKYCDFEEQLTVAGEEGRLRPDMIVRLPAGRTVVVDAKVSLLAFLEAVEAQNDDQRNKALERHAAAVRKHMDDLSRQRYWEQFKPAPDFVVFFLPGEAFFSAAVQYDRTLIEEGIEKRVILASPTTLIALLRAIAYGWRQEQLAASAQQIHDLGKQLYDRMRTLAEHFDSLRSALERAIDAYNKSVGSMETRVLPQVRKFRELGVAAAEEIPQLEPIDQAPRKLTLPDENGAE